jgi:hypothetical protein
MEADGAPPADYLHYDREGELQHLCSEDSKLLQYWPTPRKWNLISNFTKILKAYKEATDILGWDTRITVEWVIPLVDEWMQSVEDFEKKD